MMRRIAARWARWREAFRSAATLGEALGDAALYVLLRFWGVLINAFPLETNRASVRFVARIWWAIDRRHRELAITHLQFAFPDADDEWRARVARRSFEHWAQVYLVELVLTPRLVNPWSFSRYVTFEQLGAAMHRLLTDQPLIMITPHFGNFELMGYAISRLGLPLTSIMRPLDNPLLNEYLESTRAAGGLRLVHKKGASDIAPEVLDSGGALCFIADQDAGRKGIFAEFFHRRASWYKAIGLMAMQHRVPIVVGGATRDGERFHYRVGVERLIMPHEWETHADPLQWITDEFAAAFERMIRRAPSQYLWIHRRWKTRPRDEQPDEGTAAPTAAQT